MEEIDLDSLPEMGGADGGTVDLDSLPEITDNGEPSLGITETAQKDYEAATGAEAPQNPILAQIANMGLTVGGRLNANLQMRAAQKLAAGGNYDDRDMDDLMDQMVYGGVKKVSNALETVPSVVGPGAEMAMFFHGKQRQKQERVPNEIMRDWDETEGKTYKDPDERRVARMEYARQIATDFIRERSAVRQNAETELKNREVTHTANVVSRGLGMLGYTAPYLLGPVGILAQFAEEGSANAIGYANDEYGYDKVGNFVLVSRGDTPGRAALAGFGTAGFETATEVVGGKLGGAVLKRAGKIGGKALGSLAGKTVGRFPVVKKVGEAVGATAARFEATGVGRAAAKFGRGLSNVFKWTSKKFHLENPIEENIEEYESDLLNALTGFDRRASELVDPETGERTNPWGRFVDANREFFSAKHLVELNEAMLLTMGGGAFVAQCARRGAVREVDDFIREHELMGEAELKKASLEKKSAALDAWAQGLDEKETLAKINGASGWLDRLADKISGEGGKFAGEVNALREKMAAAEAYNTGAELDELELPHQKFDIPMVKDARGRNVPDFRRVSVLDVRSGETVERRAVFDDSGICISDNGKEGDSAYTVFMPGERTGRDFATLTQAVRFATTAKNARALDAAKDAMKRKFIGEIVRRDYGGANVIDVKTIGEAVEASRKLGQDVTAAEGFRTDRAGWHLKDGTVVLVRDNIHSPIQAARLLRHENVGHSAELMRGPWLDSDADSQIGRLRDANLANAERGGGVTEEQKERILRESVANAVQRRRHAPGAGGRMAHGIREALRKAGFSLRMNDADLEVVAARVERGLREGADGSHVSQDAAAVKDLVQFMEPSAGTETGKQVQPSETEGKENGNEAGTVAEGSPSMRTERDFLRVMHDNQKPVRVPVGEISLPDTQFKEGADPKTGVVKGQELKGEYFESAENAVVVYVRKDGTKELVTGRHRFDLAKRNGKNDILARVFREADGYTPEDMRNLDAISNIIDEKGTEHDYIRYFENAKLSRAAAEAAGFLSRSKGRLAFELYEGATEGTRAAIDWSGSGADGLISPEQAGIIAKAAPRDAHPRNGAVQRILVKKAQDGLRGDRLAIVARSLAEEAKSRKAPATGGEMQLDLFTSEEDLRLLALEEKRAAKRVEKANEYGRVASVLQTAMQKGGRLDLNKAYARELGIKNPKDRKQLADARQKALEKADYWRNAVRLDEADKAALDAELGAAESRERNPPDHRAATAVHKSATAVHKDETPVHESESPVHSAEKMGAKPPTEAEETAVFTRQDGTKERLDGYTPAAGAELSAGREVAVQHDTGGEVNARQKILGTVAGVRADGGVEVEYRDGWGNAERDVFRREEVVGVKPLVGDAAQPAENAPASAPRKAKAMARPKAAKPAGRKEEANAGVPSPVLPIEDAKRRVTVVTTDGDGRPVRKSVTPEEAEAMGMVMSSEPPAGAPQKAEGSADAKESGESPLDGYLAGRRPMDAARIRKTLGKEFTYTEDSVGADGKSVITERTESEASFVERASGDGGTLSATYTVSRGGRAKVVYTLGGQILSKTAADYARHLGVKVDENEIARTEESVRLKDVQALGMGVGKLDYSASDENVASRLAELEPRESLLRSRPDLAAELNALREIRDARVKRGDWHPGGAEGVAAEAKKPAGADAAPPQGPRTPSVRMKDEAAERKAKAALDAIDFDTPELDGLKSKIRNGTILTEADQRQFAEDVRKGRMRYPRFRADEIAASIGKEHGKLWQYILSLESARMDGRRARGGSEVYGRAASQVRRGGSEWGRVGTGSAQSPSVAYSPKYRKLDSGTESEVFDTGDGWVVKVRQIHPLSIGDVIDELAKVVYHNYLFPGEKYVLDDIVRHEHDGYREFYLILRQPFVTPKTENGRIVQPTYAQIWQLMKSRPQGFTFMDLSSRPAETGEYGDYSSSDGDEGEVVPAVKKVAYNRQFVVYDFQPGRNTFIDAKSGKVRFIDPRIDINDPGAGFRYSKYGTRRVFDGDVDFDTPELGVGSTIVSGDEVRKTMRGYNRLDWSTHVDRTGYVGPKLEAQFQRLLKTRKGKGNGHVVFLAGGNGAGKSTVAAKLGGTPDFTIDSTLGNLEVAKKQIDAILANGQTPDIRFVYRTPGQALEGIAQRVKNGGHIVSPLSFANSHVKSRENLRLLSEAYGDRIHIHIYDNSVPGAPEITLEQLEAKGKPDHARIRENANYYLGQLRGRDIEDNKGGVAGGGAKGEGREAQGTGGQDSGGAKGARGQVDFDTSELGIREKQTALSGGTSRNQNPSGNEYGRKWKIFKPGTRNVDIGAGRFDKATKFLADIGVTNIPFDPVNRDSETNRRAAESVRANPADTATVHNVLNVIDNDAVMEGIVNQAARAIKKNGSAIFTIYEGNRSGVGARTRDGYQRNANARSYEPTIKKFFGSVETHGNVILARRPKDIGPAFWAFDSSFENGINFDTPELGVDSTIVSGDEVRKTMPGYNRLDWSTHVDRTGYVGPRLEAQFQRLLKERKGKGDGTVVFLAGGNGAGKSTVAAKIGNSHDFTIDSTLGNLEVAKKQIDAILANGQTPDIRFVYRTPGQALEGIAQRVKNGGHIVSPLSFANSHVKSRENLRLLSEAYGDKIHLHIYDNSVDGAPEITLKQLEAKGKPDHERIRESANYYLGHLREREEARSRSQGGVAGGGAKGEASQVDFDTPELYTGSAADYANRLPDGTIENPPSLAHVGSGEGAQAFGWGLYASTVRGVAEGYAERDRRDKLHGKTYGGVMGLGGYSRKPPLAYTVEYTGGEQMPEYVRETLEYSGMTSVDDIISAREESILVESDDPDNDISHDPVISWLKRHRDEITIVQPKVSENVYEQTFFTDRAPGDESHLLNWYEPVSEEQMGWILKQAEKEGLVEKFEKENKWNRFDGNFERFITDNGLSADAIYEQLSKSGLAHSDNKYRDTSEFLARAGIDGIKYPVATTHGAPKEGDGVQFNYVSFRDDNIRVDHKWTDGEIQFDTPELDTPDFSGKRRFDVVENGNFHPNHVGGYTRRQATAYVRKVYGPSAAAYELGALQNYRRNATIARHEEQIRAINRQNALGLRKAGVLVTAAIKAGFFDHISASQVAQHDGGIGSRFGRNSKSIASLRGADLFGVRGIDVNGWTNYSDGSVVVPLEGRTKRSIKNIIALNQVFPNTWRFDGFGEYNGKLYALVKTDKVGSPIEADIPTKHKFLEDNGFSRSRAYEKMLSMGSDFWMKDGIGVDANELVLGKTADGEMFAYNVPCAIREYAIESGNADIDFDTPELDSARREHDAVVARYTNADGTKKPGWMKAPNGKPTKLTERQWAQVRTPSFKKWFGDWERLAELHAARDFALNSEPVAEVSGNDFQKDPTGANTLIDRVADYFAKLGGKAESPDLGTVELTRTGVKSSIAHGIGAKKAAAFAAVKDVIEKGIVFDRNDDWKGRGYATAAIAAPIRMGGKDYVCELIVNRYKDRNAFYLHEVNLKEKLSDTIKTATGAVSIGESARPVASIIAQRLAEVNPASVSKVVDENGEPLVAYHDSSERHNILSRDFARKSMDIEAVFFHFKQDKYHEYGNVEHAVFLNIRNPANFAQAHEGFEYGVTEDAGVRQREKLQSEGFDGAIFDAETMGGDELAEALVFDSRQIKSATDNAGAFDAANPDIRFDSPELDPEARAREIASFTERYYSRQRGLQRLAKPSASDVMDAAEGRWAKFRRIVQDKNLVIREVEERLGVTDKRESVYYAKDREFGLNEYQLGELQRRRVDPILDRLAETGASQRDFDLYLIARHAPYRNAVLRERGVTDGAGMGDAEAAEVIEGFNRLGVGDEFAAIADMVYAMNDEALQRRVDSGRVSPEEAETLRRTLVDYVPLRTDMENDERDAHNTYSSGWHQSEFQMARGRRTLADSPLAWSIVQAERSIRDANANRVRQTAAALVRKSAAMGKPIGEIIPGTQVRRRWAFNIGGEVLTLEELRDRTDLIFFKEDGKLKAIRMNVGANSLGNTFAKAVTDKDLVKFSKWFEWIPRLTRAMSAMRTQYVPTFIVRNLKADHIEVLLNAGSERGIVGGAKFFGRLVANEWRNRRDVRDYFRDGELRGRMKEFVENGGLTGGGMAAEGFSEAARRVDHTLRTTRGGVARKVAAAIPDAISLLNACAEFNTRVGVFSALRDEGVGVEDAVSYARDATVNFNRRGSLTPYLNAAFMFSNAAIQGLGRAFKSMRSEHGKQMVTLLFLVGFLQSLLDHFLGRDEDREKEGLSSARNLSEHEKQSTVGVPLPGGLRLKTQIRNPWALPMYAGRKAGELLTGWTDGGTAVADLASAAGGFVTEPVGGNGFGSVPEAMQTFAPTLLDPFVQWATGVDFKGDRRLRKNYSDHLPDSWNGRINTPDVYKWISQGANAISGGSRFRKGAFDTSPENWQLLAETVLGGALADLNRAVSTVKDARLAALGAKPEQVLRDVPFVRDTLTNLPDVSSRYYDALSDYEADRTEYSGLARTDAGKAEAFATSHPWAVGSENPVVGIVWKLGRAVQEAETPSEAAKLRREQLAEMAGFVRRMEEARKAGKRKEK